MGTSDLNHHPGELFSQEEFQATKKQGNWGGTGCQNMHNKVNLIWMDFFTRCHLLSHDILIYELCGHYFWEMFYVKGFCGQIMLGNIAPFISVTKIHDVC